MPNSEPGERRHTGRVDGLYEGFQRDPSWLHMPSPDYLRGTVADLRRLSTALRTAVVLVDRGEATWPRDLVAAAIDELADSGRPLRALIGEPVLQRGTRYVRPLAIAEEPDVDVTRERLLEALGLLGPGERGTVIWEPSDAP